MLESIKYMKILKSIFIILLLVTIIESGYLFYILTQNKNQKGNLNNSVDNQASANPITVENIDASKSDKLVSEEALNNVTNYLKTRPKNSAQKFYLIEETEGIINNIEKQSNNTVIHITDSQGNRAVSLFFLINSQTGKPDLKNFYREINGNKTLLTDLNEIKSGQKIKKNTERLLNDDSIMKEEIVVYGQ